MGIFFRGKVSCTALTTKVCQQLRLYRKYAYGSLVTFICVVDEWCRHLFVDGSSEIVVVLMCDCALVMPQNHSPSLQFSAFRVCELQIPTTV